MQRLNWPSIYKHYSVFIFLAFTYWAVPEQLIISLVATLQYWRWLQTVQDHNKTLAKRVSQYNNCGVFLETPGSCLKHPVKTGTELELSILLKIYLKSFV